MLNRLKALVVDTDADSALDVSEALTAAGLEVYSVDSLGTEPLVLAGEVRPHVILMALDSLDDRSLQTMEELHVRYRWPILAYSAEGTTELAQRALRAGARDLLVRPLTAAAVEESVETALSREELRNLGGTLDAEGHRTRGTVITIAGAKGGIGKSTLAVNLAIPLRQLTGDHVALVDSDAQFGDIAGMLGMQVEHGIADLARRGAEHVSAEIEQYLHSHSSGVDVLAATGRPDDWRALNVDEAGAITRELADSYDFVVVDTPGTMSEMMAAAVYEASLVLLVTNRDVASVKDAVTALRLFDHWAVPRENVRLIINDNNHTSIVSAKEVASSTGMEVTAEFRYESRVMRSIEHPEPVMVSDPNGRFARSTRRLAEQLTGVGSGSRRRLLPSLARV